MALNCRVVDPFAVYENLFAGPSDTTLASFAALFRTLFHVASGTQGMLAGVEWIIGLLAIVCCDTL